MSIKKVGQDGEYLYFLEKKKFLFTPFFDNDNCIAFYQFCFENLDISRLRAYKNSFSLSHPGRLNFFILSSQKVRRKIKLWRFSWIGFFLQLPVKKNLRMSFKFTMLNFISID